MNWNKLLEELQKNSSGKQDGKQDGSVWGMSDDDQEYSSGGGGGVFGALGGVPVVGSVLGGLGLGGDSGVSDAYGNLTRKATPAIKSYNFKSDAIAGRQFDYADALSKSGAPQAKQFGAEAAGGMSGLAGWSSKESDPAVQSTMKANSAGAATGAAYQKASGAANGTSPIQQAWAAYQGPGRQAEQFYAGAQSGNDPYYDRMAEKTSRDMQRAAIARGGFNSGRALRAEGEALSNLRAQQYNKMADLSVATQNASNASDATAAGIAGKATDAQQAANQLMVAAANATDDTQRQWYTTLAGLMQNSDKLNLDWGTTMASQSANNAKDKASINQLYQTLGADTFNRAAATEAAGAETGLEALLTAYGIPVQAALAKQQQQQQGVGNLIGAAGAILPFVL